MFRWPTAVPAAALVVAVVTDSHPVAVITVGLILAACVTIDLVTWRRRRDEPAVS